MRRALRLTSVWLACALLTVAAPGAIAVTAADPSDVVLVLDFSRSILDDRPNRERFAAALEEIADRVDETRDELVTGDVTITFVAFASRALAYPSCVNLGLLGSSDAVEAFSRCLRRMAGQYVRGVDAPVRADVGNDTNYVAALEVAARYVPEGAARPAVIFFTDGKHDIERVPESRVLPKAKALFGARSPFAFLPVGMGLDAARRDALESRLRALGNLTRDMKPCPNGEDFEWPTVVFPSAIEAGHAVATALEQVTCTFTVAEEPVPTPPLVVPPGTVLDVHAVAGNGTVEVAWHAPTESGTDPISGYRVRCRAVGTEAWAVSRDTPPDELRATFTGLENGASYECEVSAVSVAGAGAWSPSDTAATPAGPPGPPAGIRVEAQDSAALATVVAGPDGGTPVRDYRYECSADAGVTWTAVNDPVTADVASRLTGLTNGTEYTCRAYAENAVGVSSPSSISPVFRPCGDLLECNPPLRWLLLGLAIALATVALMAVIRWWRSRTRKYITAHVDELGAVSLGRGPNAGMSFAGGELQRDPRSSADVRVRLLPGSRFEVTSAGQSTKVSSGQQVEVFDADGQSHLMTLRAHDRPPVAMQPTPPGEDEWSTAPTPPAYGNRPVTGADEWD